MRRQISCYLMDPTKNMTILVETPVPEASFPFVAQKLMELVPEAEQVGFVHRGESDSACDSGTGTAFPTLRMAGGEFCGNASMSAAVYYALREGISEGTILLDVSGAADPVEVRIRKAGDSAGADDVGSAADKPDEIWYGRVHMPKPLSISEERFPDGSILPVVRFEGIAHVIIDGTDESAKSMPVAAMKQDADLAGSLAKAWCEYLQADAVGLMFLNETHDEMRPLVYVPAAGTCIWESSCASGTTAAGVYLAQKAGLTDVAAGAVRYQLRQPGGVLEIEVTPEGDYYLMGQVAVCARQEVMVEYDLL